MKSSDEKRRDPRVTDRVIVRSTHNDANLETINLSAGGLLCTSPAWVAPMTKMALSLELPMPTPKAPRLVEGEAVVVRTDPPAPTTNPGGGYRVALFFSRMDAEHREALDQFLKLRSQ
jgi:hypothetical protein